MTSTREPNLLSPSLERYQDTESTRHPPIVRLISVIRKVIIAFSIFAVIVLIPADVLLGLYGDKIRRIHPSSWPLEWIFATASSSCLILITSLTIFLHHSTALRYATTLLLVVLPAASAILLLLPGISKCPSKSSLPYFPAFLPSSPAARSHFAWISRDPHVCTYNRVLVGIFLGAAVIGTILMVLEIHLFVKNREHSRILDQWQREEEQKRGIRLEVGSLGGSIGLSEMVERTMRRNRASYISTRDDNHQSWGGEGSVTEDVGQGNSNLELYPSGRPFSEVSSVGSVLEDGQWTDFTGDRSYVEGERWGPSMNTVARGSVGYAL